MNKTFLLTLEHGHNFETDKSLYDQKNWETHTRFMDKLFLQGKISVCGALKDESKVVLIANGKNESSIRNLFKDDPFIKNGVFILTHVDEIELHLNPEMVDE